MKVKELINQLKRYDPEKEVYFMKERPNDDIIQADEIHEIEQRILTRNDFESSEFTAIILLHELPYNPYLLSGNELKETEDKRKLV